MTEPDSQLLDELRIRRLIERYCALLDCGEIDELLDLFDEDCSFSMMGQAFRGRSELTTVWSRLSPTDRPATLHAVVNPVISVDGDRATAVTGWAMLDRSGPDRQTVIALAGWYFDELTRGSDGAWRFNNRRVQKLARPRQ
ncbi:nuclear transport factor 2 family protein [Mycolicibacterium moriokaense]|uniref:SnoaL-like protein n=1 Tax=Mycolicibacterium moriokaense TaxID=39691 RepID=A0A318HJS6_9MYCO|nr:nuclear transport factor 2 family protein [Mycolicibacterium moriokaense]PXX01622.1 SnoaL-like protein [Mycolicibacterium moriokaense]